MGSVSEFNKLLFTAVARTGYRKIEETVVVEDGAQWIWNMVKEMFPDAVEIFDCYHLNKNTDDYAKAIYPDDEVSRKRWIKSIMDYILDGDTKKAVGL